MIKKITIDTNSDLFGEASNLYLEVIDNITGITTSEYPTFREVLDGVVATGIYFCEIDLENGNYYITVKHTTLSSSGSVHYVMSEDEHTILEDSIMELSEEDDNSSTFA